NSSTSQDTSILGPYHFRWEVQVLFRYNAGEPKASVLRVLCPCILPLQPHRPIHAFCNTHGYALFVQRHPEDCIGLRTCTALVPVQEIVNNSSSEVTSNRRDH